ncbi:parallel beta-helix repeat (two copies) [Leptolyngbya sp. Heron Island J]|uniref:inverse autotransporter beta-barrel domain-containing protein n=1 Tax=Leptolyngbya sp. Heron Island J TaxID=1385935 RepID=UPI0003B9752D|nr:inverse autotransporter beta-barrel domain-containing protein [Leptolyngbya sp. Heron Island J]ESA38585.1 parallel beta-helix repeat (two copies) [Leptolyngbya sp. Heron Island J]
MVWNRLQKVSIYSILALLLCSTAANAQDAEGGEPVDATRATTTDTISPRLGVDFNSPRHGDDERSFGRVTGFIPLWQTPGNNLTFLDTAVRLNSTGELGGTVTVGQRYLYKSMVVGGHLSYDVRDTGNNTFNQLGLGIEVFGDLWDFHLNGYLPIGDTQASAGRTGGTGQVTDTRFQGNQLVFLTEGGSEFLESAWGGVDLDAGMQLVDWEDWGQLWGYGGVYYHGDAIGGRLRVDHRVQDWLRLGLGVQSDDNFGTRGFFSVGFSWGGGRQTRSDTDALWFRAAESVTRNSAIVVKESEVVTAGSTEIALNPATGLAYSFQHVTPDATSTAGDGTIENPAANLNLINVQAGDIIYVREGDSRTNPLAPFTVPGEVTVIAAAIAENISTQLGDIPLPGAGVDDLPLVDATGFDNGITLTGSNIRLAGFEVFGANVNGIFATNAPNAIIENNISRNNTLVAIGVEGASDGAIVRNNQLDANSVGIGIATSVDVLVQQNQITNSLGLGIGFIEADNGIIDTNIISDGAGAAIGVLSGSGIAISNNQIINTNTDIGTLNSPLGPLGSPAAVVVGALEGDVTITGNIVTGSTGSLILNGQGILVGSNAGTMALTLEGNTISNNQGDGFNLLLAGDGTATVDIVDNIIENNGSNAPTLRGDGIKIAIEEDAQITQLAIAENQLIGNFDDGLDISLGQFQNIPLPIPIPIPGIGTAIGSSNAQLSNAESSNNVITDNQNGQGIILRSLGDNSSLLIVVDNNELTNNVGGGLEASSLDTNADGSTNLCLALTNNNSDNGYQLNEIPGSTFTVVNRDAVDALNTGAITFFPVQLNFDTVADAASCP